MTVLDPSLFVREMRRQRLSLSVMASRCNMTIGRLNAIIAGSHATKSDVEAIAHTLGVLPSDVAPEGGEE